MPATCPARPSRTAFDAAAREDEIAVRVEAVAAAGGGADLVPLLEERHPLYRGRSANQSLRLRGWAMAALELAGMPDDALPQVLSELESGREPYLVAAAARALRGLPGPEPRVVPYLLAALGNLRFADDAVSFESYRPSWPAAERRTAAEEVLETLGGMGAAARPALGELRAMLEDRGRPLGSAGRSAVERAMACIEAGPAEVPGGCCGLPAARRGVRRIGAAARRSARRLRAVELEDQEGRRLGYRDFFARGEPSVAVFFYTRCPNPLRCSLTVTRLAGLQRALAAAGLGGRVRTAAISYDAGHDGPGRLATYGADRGLATGERDRLFRVVAGGSELDGHFELGVNYLGSIVNRHRVELFVIDGEGRIAARFTHLRWRDDEVIEAVRGLCEPAGSTRTRTPRGVLPTAASAAAVLLPKCPLCWAAYGSALGIGGAGSLFAGPWLPAAVAALLLVHLAALRRGAARRNGRGPFRVSLAGAALVVVSLLAGSRPAGLAGVVMLAAGALLGGLPRGVLSAGAARLASLLRRGPAPVAPRP